MPGQMPDGIFGGGVETSRGRPSAVGDMRIVVIGQAAFGESVLNALVDRGDTVVAAWCPPDVDGGRVDRLKAAAEKRGVPVFQFKRMRDREAIETFQALNADLCVMAFVTDIVPGDILNAPARGTYSTIRHCCRGTGGPARSTGR